MEHDADTEAENPPRFRFDRFQRNADRWRTGVVFARIGDFPDAKSAATNPKNGGGNIGADYLADLCARIEAEAMGGQLRESFDLIGEIKMSYPYLLEVFNERQPKIFNGG